eukprot:Sspe_Gene.16062::Locus_5649_Transcript_1_1_Confidence_1.000_Length_4925::g.16062::m.16062
MALQEPRAAGERGPSRPVLHTLKLLHVMVTPCTLVVLTRPKPPALAPPIPQGLSHGAWWEGRIQGGYLSSAGRTVWGGTMVDRASPHPVDLSVVDGIVFNCAHCHQRFSGVEGYRRHLAGVEKAWRQGGGIPFSNILFSKPGESHEIYDRNEAIRRRLGVGSQSIFYQRQAWAHQMASVLAGAEEEAKPLGWSVQKPSDESIPVATAEWSSAVADRVAALQRYKRTREAVSDMWHTAVLDNMLQDTEREPPPDCPVEKVRGAIAEAEQEIARWQGDALARQMEESCEAWRRISNELSRIECDRVVDPATKVQQLHSLEIPTTSVPPYPALTPQPSDGPSNPEVVYLVPQ